MERRFPFRQFHRCSPVYSLRIHWVFLVPSSHRLGAFAFSPHPGVHGFPVLRLLCPIRLFLVSSGFRWGLPYLLSISLHIHKEVSRVRHVGLKRNALGGVCWMPHPLFVAPQCLHGVDQVYPCHLVHFRTNKMHRPLLPPSVLGFMYTDGHSRQGMPGCAFPEGLYYASCESP